MLATNKNVGDLLDGEGHFVGLVPGRIHSDHGIRSGERQHPAVQRCKTTTNRIDGTPEAAYSAHHNPFQYYKSTSNPHHTRADERERSWDTTARRITSTT